MTLTRQLQLWQAREAGYRFSWATARVIAVAFAALAVCCIADYLIDRHRDTPMGLRVAMTAAQAVILAYVAYRFLWRLRVPTLDQLASKAEESDSAFDHRLVTSLQLNRPAARTEGMSAVLIAEVTREAETLSAGRNLSNLADATPVKRAVAVLLPVAALAFGFAAVNPELAAALVSRQLLLPVEIPRSVRITPEADDQLVPAGDEVSLRFRVAGRFTEEAVGVAIVQPEGQPPEEYALAFDSTLPDGEAVFAAKMPPMSVPFAFRGRLLDARTRRTGSVRFEPRPVVTEVNAWLRLPAFVDPEGKRRYERFQPQGEVTALVGGGIRVETKATKPLAKAEAVLLRRGADGKDEVAGRIPLALTPDRQSAGGAFDLPAKVTAYRIEVSDDNGFANRNPPRRGISLAPDDPPKVNLLAEVLKDPRDPGPLDDYDVTGMPLVLGGRVQVGYFARSPLGLARAEVVYRVNDGDWTRLPLSLTVADPEKLGRFLPDLGLFENSGYIGQVEFYPLPSADPATDPPGLEAGGRYNFETAALKKKGPDGGDARLEIGDRVEFYVAVYDRTPDPARPAGKSESRIKAVVSQAALEDWTRQRDQSRERLRQLEERQRGVFRPSP